MVIQRIGPLSLAKIIGTLYAAMGLLAGAVVSMIATVGGFGADNPGFGPFAVLMGVGAIVVLPIFYGLLGFIAAAIGAFLYNLLAGSVGGIELDVR